jgi:uncharacterized membrane protein
MQMFCITIIIIIIFYIYCFLVLLSQHVKIKNLIVIIIIIICNLFNDAFSVTQTNKAPYERVISEWLIGKDVEGSGSGLI